MCMIKRIPHRRRYVIAPAQYTHTCNAIQHISIIALNQIEKLVVKKRNTNFRCSRIMTSQHQKYG